MLQKYFFIFADVEVCLLVIMNIIIELVHKSVIVDYLFTLENRRNQHQLQGAFEWRRVARRAAWGRTGHTSLHRLSSLPHLR